MVPGNLLFRVDANVSVGTGHVMRCLALAQAWQADGGRAIFAMAEVTPALEGLLLRQGIELTRVNSPAGASSDSIETAELALQQRAKWTVIDGYRFDADYQRSLKASGLKLLFIDDNGHADHYCADLVLNQNLHATDGLYINREAHTRLLLGPRYALLRREFEKLRGWNREIPVRAKNILVTMGGSDPHNVTQSVIAALSDVAAEGLTIDVVVGGSNPHLAGLEHSAARAVAPITLVKDPFNMPELLSRADLAISGAGTTCWEMCFLGLPSILVVLAENQVGIAKELAKLGISINLGRREDLEPASVSAAIKSLLHAQAKRESMSRLGRELVDGHGAQRVVNAIRSRGLQLRRAEQKDCRLLWEWANDPLVRSSSFSTERISWESHVSWFTTKLRDPDCLIFIGADEQGTPIGQIRFEKRSGSEAEVALSVAREKRGLGYAASLIEIGTREVFQKTDIIRLHALIKPDNRASAAAFEHAGYVAAESVPVKGQLALHYVQARPWECEPLPRRVEAGISARL
jgi:UDP-2,4-diacetamido-2,4,6-trideoxy-beta-L-altropyranose hydrolase